MDKVRIARGVVTGRTVPNGEKWWDFEVDVVIATAVRSTLDSRKSLAMHGRACFYLAKAWRLVQPSDMPSGLAIHTATCSQAAQALRISKMTQCGEQHIRHQLHAGAVFLSAL